MDLFKKYNVKLATAFDFNCPRIVKLKDRKNIHHMINRYSRRKLKQNIDKEVNNYELRI